MWLQVPGNYTQEGSSLQRHNCPRTMLGVMVVHEFSVPSASLPPTTQALTPAQCVRGLALWDSHLPLGSKQLGAAGPAGDQQLPSGQQWGGMFFPPVSTSFSPPPLVPGQAIICSFLITPFAVPGCACLPSAVGRAVTQPHAHLLTPTCSIPARCGILPALCWWTRQVPGSGLSSSAHPCLLPPILPLSQEWPPPVDQLLNP